MFDLKILRWAMFYTWTGLLEPCYRRNWSQVCRRLEEFQGFRTNVGSLTKRGLWPTKYKVANRCTLVLSSSHTLSRDWHEVYCGCGGRSVPCTTMPLLRRNQRPLSWQDLEMAYFLELTTWRNPVSQTTPLVSLLIPSPSLLIPLWLHGLGKRWR